MYPVNELISSEIAVASPELRAQRLDVINRLTNGEAPIVVAPVAALRRMLPPVEVWKNSQMLIQVGHDIEPDQLASRLVEVGYERSDMVSAPGEFSIRGGIVDIYPLTSEHPVRIELLTPKWIQSAALTQMIRGQLRPLPRSISVLQRN